MNCIEVWFKTVRRTYLQFGCVDRGGEIPDLISNSEVKSSIGEGSARETVCENNKMHPFYIKKPTLRVGFFFGKLCKLDKNLEEV